MMNDDHVSLGTPESSTMTTTTTLSPASKAEKGPIHMTTTNRSRNTIPENSCPSSGDDSQQQNYSRLQQNQHGKTNDANGVPSSAVSSHRLIRFKWWVILILCSLILAGSLVEAYYQFYNGLRNWELTVDQKRTFYLAIVSAIAAFVGLVVSTIPRKIFTRIESVLIIGIVATFAVGSVFTTIRPEPPSIGERFIVAAPNIFFFGWGCVFTSIILFASWVEHNIQHDDGIATMQWILLGSTSTVTMMSALALREESIHNINVFSGNMNINGTITSTGSTSSILSSGNGNNGGGSSICELYDGLDCSRVHLAIVFGSISAAISIVMAFWRTASAVCQAELGLIMLIIWLVGVIMFTFETGPGTVMGTIFFSTWASFFLSVTIVAKTVSIHIQNPEDDYIDKDEVNGGEREPSPDAVERQRSVDESVVQKVADNDEEVGRRKSRFFQARPTIVERGEIFETAYTQFAQEKKYSAADLRRQGTGASLFESINAMEGTDDSIPNTDDNKEDDTNPSQTLVTTLADLGTHPGQERLGQLKYWVGLLGASVVCLGSILPSLSGKGSRSTDEMISFITPSVSIFLSCVGYCTCLSRRKMARWIQFGLICGSILIWTGGMRSIFKTEYLRYDFEANGKEDPNTFCSTWAAFAFSLFLLTRWLQLSLTATDWFLLSAFSFALMGTSYVSYNEQSIATDKTGTEFEVRRCEVVDETECKRILVSGILGMASGIVSLLMVPLSMFIVNGLEVMFSMAVHVVIGVIYLITWICACAIIAYGTGHGAQAGSAYLQVWTCVFLALDVATTNIVLLIRERRTRKDLSRESQSE